MIWHFVDLRYISYIFCLWNLGFLVLKLNEWMSACSSRTICFLGKKSQQRKEWKSWHCKTLTPDVWQSWKNVPFFALLLKGAVRVGATCTIPMVNFQKDQIFRVIYLIVLAILRNFKYFQFNRFWKRKEYWKMKHFLNVKWQEQ